MGDETTAGSCSSISATKAAWSSSSWIQSARWTPWARRTTSGTNSW